MAIAASFLIAPIFTGLQPLWDTRFAASLLLLAAAVLVGLINAAYQDGDSVHRVPVILRYPGSLAVLALVALVALAYQAVALRVTQYGWTADHIYAMACVMITAFCAGGYAVAASWPNGPWLKRIELWNIYTALAALAVLIALFSPIADPYRISVASQVARLESGATPPEKFDFENLRFAGGRYGYAALETLKMTEATSRPAFVRQMAESAAKATRRSPVFANAEEVERVMDRIDVRTPGKALPASFLPQNLQGSFGCPLQT